MPRTLTRFGLTTAALLLSLASLNATSTAPTPTTYAKSGERTRGARLEKTLARMPARFEVNAGQAAGHVKFLSRGAGHTLMLTAEGATLALRADDAPSFRFIGMKFVGANTRAEVSGEGRLAGRVNYFVGRDPSKWRAGVETFASVRYRELYRGVDLVYHGGGGDRLEYDFVLAPGADYRPIRLRFDGVERLSVGAGGELLLHTRAGTIRQSAPVVYQQRGGERREVAGRYVLRGAREVGFRLGEYDRSLPLVIDPVLVYSTYFHHAYKMAVDDAGGVYVVGTADTIDGDFPATPGAFQTTRRGWSDAYVAKLNPEGTELSYLTYVGGADDSGGGLEWGQDIAVDAAGNAYVTGLTLAKDFPTVGAFQPANAGDSEGFVAKLNPSGSALVYSSYLGGTGPEWGTSVAVDGAGSAYLFGHTFSNDFPVLNAIQPVRKGGEDFFVTKVAPDGKALVYSTHLGGTGMEAGYLGDLAVDAAGAAYVAGTSYSPDYPTTPGAFRPATNTPNDSFNSNIVVTKIAPGGSALVYSTYLGGSNIDFAHAVAVDASGQAHVVGSTTSTDFPVLNALHATARGPYGNGFLAKLNAAGTALVYSTYLSGTPKLLCGPQRLTGAVFFCGGDGATGVATDAAGNAYVTGYTVSDDFPVPSGDALQSQLSGFADAFLVKLGPAGQALYSTYLGGSYADEGADVHADAGGTVYLFGYTASDDFPVVRAYRGGAAREGDPLLGSFVAKLSETDAPTGTSRVRFDSASYAVAEGGGSVVVGVTRAGDLSGAVEVGYSTGGDGADERSDYTTARGTLRFAPGESSKSFAVSVTDDNSVEGDETVNLTLHDLRGPAALAAPSSVVLTIADDDEQSSAANPIDSSEFFVRQHYLDFLSREPDAAGLAFWTNEIESCGSNQGCRELRRVNVSAAFFLSIEFQETGFLGARLHSLAFGARVNYRAFVRDSRAVGEGVVVGRPDWQAKLAANRRAHAEEFVARPAFREELPESLTAAQYVERLNAKASGALSTSEFAALVAGLEAGAETRATALLRVADDADFRAREFAPAFVLMQYLGYLRRNPDDWPDNGDGYNFWLSKLNSFGGDFQKAEMVKAFLDSFEYRRRFHEPTVEVALGSPFKLKQGETAVVGPDKLRLSLVEVGNDSRCPRNVQCVHAGSASILVRAVKPGGASARFVLSIPGLTPRPHPSNPPTEALGYKFRLLQLDPEPPHGTNPPPTEALIRVDKS